MSISLYPITFEELKTLISKAYTSDPELIERYQKGNADLEGCIDYNYNEILALLPVCLEDLEAWAIRKGEDAIGYCVTITGTTVPMLYSFAIEKQHRTKENLTGWLDQVEQKLGSLYYTALWHKNTRGKEFLIKNDFRVIPSKDQPFDYFVKGDTEGVKNNIPWQ